MLPDHIQNACDWANMRGWRVFPANPLKRPLRNVLVFGFSRLGRHCLVRCAASGRMSGVFLGQAALGALGVILILFAALRRFWLIAAMASWA